MRRITLALGLVVLAATPCARAAMLDPNWTESVFSANRNGPGDFSLKLHTGLGWAPDGSDRLFVLEKNGRVRILKGATTSANPAWSTFATMAPIHTIGDSGLLGFAFDPNFAANQHVYFFVTSTSTAQEILRYTASGDLGIDRTVIVGNLPTIGTIHNGGALAFGADGQLYFSLGDLGNASGVDDDLATIASKIGRIDREGGASFGNPFVDGAGPNDDRIYARAFRNPFTMTFQPSNGRLWANVVGQAQEQVFALGPGDHAGWNDYENNQPPPTITQQYVVPAITYRTNGTNARALASAVRSGNVATFTTSVPHLFRLGENITISGLDDASFNKTVYVLSTASPTVFVAANVGPDAAAAPAGSAFATTLDQGGSVTGGTFYDSSGAPAAYRGNYFYGDYNADRIMRATLDANTNAVRTVDYWASDLTGQVDIAVGPDGALYYTGVTSNTIYRAAYNAQAQGIVVSTLNTWMDEAGTAVLTARLAVAPPGVIAVNVSRASGDTDIAVSAGTTLLFGPTDWNRPQAVTLAAAPDADKTDDTAIIQFEASGLATVQAAVTALDDDADLDKVFRDSFE